MDKETITVQTQEEPRRIEQDWAEAEWFQVWLRLARHEYQGDPHSVPLKQAA